MLKFAEDWHCPLGSLKRELQEDAMCWPSLIALISDGRPTVLQSEPTVDRQPQPTDEINMIR
jgi:hypothetical protein